MVYKQQGQFVGHCPFNIVVFLDKYIVQYTEMKL
jgi:hypothetical protein